MRCRNQHLIKFFVSILFISALPVLWFNFKVSPILWFNLKIGINSKHNCSNILYEYNLIIENYIREMSKFNNKTINVNHTYKFQIYSIKDNEIYLIQNNDFWESRGFAMDCMFTNNKYK